MYQGPNYGRHTLLNPSFRNTGGMAAPSANARGGVFGPQGYGGGIFDGMSGMGSPVGQGVEPVVAPVETSEGNYPWMEYSLGTFSLQTSANVDFMLSDPEMPTIKEDGVLGPQTCGALEYLVDEGSPGTFVPGTCKEFADYPESTFAPPTPAPTPGPGPTPRDEDPKLERGGARGFLLTGLVVAGFASAAIAGYMVFGKGKGR